MKPSKRLKQTPNLPDYSRVGIHFEQLPGLVKVKSRDDINFECRLFYELGEYYLTDEEKKWNDWVRGVNPVKLKFRNGKVVQRTLDHYLFVGAFTSPQKGIPEKKGTWVRSGYFKEVKNVADMLSIDTRLNDPAYIEHHNFHVIKPDAL